MRYVILKTLIVLFACMFSINAEAFTISKTVYTNNLGLVGHWTFDGSDISGTLSSASVVDRSGNVNTGALQNLNLNKNLVAGKLGQAAYFDGASQYVAVSDNNTLDFGDVFTYSLWIKRDRLSYSSYEVLASKHIGSPVVLIWGTSSGAAVNKVSLCKHSGGCLVDSTAPIADTNWHLVTVTKNGSTVKMYIDGSDVTGTVSNQTMVSTASSFHIAAESAAPSDYFKGTLDDVRVYNRAISEKEVKILFSQGNSRMASTVEKRTSGLVGHWTFDGKDMLTGAVIDKSGNGNGGSLIAMATSTSRAEGKLGQSLVFDGSDDYVRVPRSVSLEAAQGMTVTGWFKRDGAQLQYASVVSKTVSDGATTPYIQFGVEFNSNSDTDIQFCTGHTTNLHQCQATGTDTIPDGKWIFFAGVHDRVNNTISIYIGVDGAPLEVDSKSAQTADLKTDANRDLTIGAYLQSGVVRRFKGKIDDVRLYNRTFTAAEVQQLYETGK